MCQYASQSDQHESRAVALKISLKCTGLHLLSFFFFPQATSDCSFCLFGSPLMPAGNVTNQLHVFEQTLMLPLGDVHRQMCIQVEKNNIRSQSLSMNHFFQCLAVSPWCSITSIVCPSGSPSVLLHHDIYDVCTLLSSKMEHGFTQRKFYVQARD